jgi:hypothetical protein
MLIFGKDILNQKIVTNDNDDSVKRKVDDLLLNKKTYDLEYLLFVENRPDKHNKEQNQGATSAWISR